MSAETQNISPCCAAEIRECPYLDLDGRRVFRCSECNRRLSNLYEMGRKP